MVPKEMFESLCNMNKAGHYHLPPSCIRGAFHLRSSSFERDNVVNRKSKGSAGIDSNDDGDGGVESTSWKELIDIEVSNDLETFERAQQAMKKLRKLSGNNILAPLPPSVPELPLAFLARNHLLDQLKEALVVNADSEMGNISSSGGSSISSSNKRSLIGSANQVSTTGSSSGISLVKRCVLQGMGGMGKSTVVASFLHDSEVCCIAMWNNNPYPFFRLSNCQTFVSVTITFGNSAHFAIYQQQHHHHHHHAYRFELHLIKSYGFHWVIIPTYRPCKNRFICNLRGSPFQPASDYCHLVLYQSKEKHL
jgi:hypothetical protein